jgi:hypothetical protein
VNTTSHSKTTRSGPINLSPPDICFAIQLSCRKHLKILCPRQSQVLQIMSERLRRLATLKRPHLQPALQRPLQTHRLMAAFKHGSSSWEASAWCLRVLAGSIVRIPSTSCSTRLNSATGIGVFQDYYQSHQLSNYSSSTVAWIPATESFFMFFCVRLLRPCQR